MPTTETEASIIGSRPDRAAVVHLLVSTAFLVVGGFAWVLMLVAGRFPDIVGGPLSYGRLRPVAFLLVLIGWLTTALVGGIYYLLPRLTGSRLWREDVAHAGAGMIALVTLAGAGAIVLGFGDGSEPFGLPLWLDVPLVAILALPAVVAIRTVATRVEHHAFISLWYVLGGVVWLPVFVLVGAFPGLGPLGSSLQGSVATWGLANAWVVGVGTGLGYYALVKSTGKPLASRRLAAAGFWSLMFAAGWAGPLQLVAGPGPDWLDGVALLLTLALPVAALATVTNFSLTIDDGWPEVGDRPVVAAALGGGVLSLIAGLMVATAGFRSAGTTLGFTAFWDGMLTITLFGAGGLLVAAWAYQALPPMMGRELLEAPARLHIRLTLWGVVGTGVLLVLAGFAQGFAWSGGSFTGLFIDAGDGWTASAGLTGTLSGLAIFTGLVTFAGQLAFALTVYRTIASGRATSQELIVPVAIDE
ncbi:MAG: cbb3-type cytochrome c oxidase subunit I [Acidimicrobiia bacterium]